MFMNRACFLVIEGHGLIVLCPPRTAVGVLSPIVSYKLRPTMVFRDGTTGGMIEIR